MNEEDLKKLCTLRAAACWAKEATKDYPMHGPLIEAIAGSMYPYVAGLHNAQARIRELEAELAIVKTNA